MLNTTDAKLLKSLILLCIILNGLVMFDRGDGKTVSWSFTGKLMGIKWKYIGICVDQATGTTTTSVKNSRDGSVEHCLRDLFQKLGARQEL
uniref:Uncharacterized protein n=1 Tax=Magallana gigas TaxID=29159 RepID=K1QP13_MAGGI